MRTGRLPFLPLLVSGFVLTHPLSLSTASEYEPKNEIERQTIAALNKGCARCHEDGKLEDRLKPAKGFGNVLQLDQLSVDPNLVLPGNPDGSRLFQSIVNREMPYDVYQEGDFLRDSPTEEEIAAIRAWITGLGEEQAAGCKGDTDSSHVSISAAIANDLGKLSDHRRSNTRYITLTHLAARCASDEEMKVYRQGIIKLLNSLSENSDVIRLETVDEAETIIRFNLDDLNWIPGKWDLLASRYPYGVRPLGSQFDFVQNATNTAIPYLRGDWLAFFASRPPLYHELLDLPDTFEGLQRKLGVDVNANVRNFQAKRSGFQNSGVSRNNRLIERHTISTGAFWTSYDFAGNRESQSLFLAPLGPAGVHEFAYDAFTHDGGETIYNLPNGFQAYYLNAADGSQLNKGPTAIVLDPSRRDQSVTNGISCIGCHDNGIRNATDEVRDHIAKTKAFSLRIREAVAALYPEKEEMDAILVADREKFQSSMRKAGLDPQLKLNGVEMVNALSDRYERDVDLELAAAEFGADRDSLRDALMTAGGSGPLLAARLDQGTIPRDQFEAEYPRLVERLIDATPISPGAPAVLAAHTGAQDGHGPVRVSIVANKSKFRLGDKPVFTVRTDRDCRLTLINVDSKGIGTVIFPNRFDQNNAIIGNRDFQYPAADAAFDFAFSAAGTETVIAICDTKGNALEKVVHDFKANEFTDLGRTAYRKIDVVKREKVPKTPTAKKPIAAPVGRSAVKLEVR